MTPHRRRAVTESSADEKRAALSNTGVRVSQRVERLVAIPDWKSPAMFARLQKVVGSTVRIVDTRTAFQRDSVGHKAERNSSPSFVREGVLTDLAWAGNAVKSSIQIDGRWFAFAISDILDGDADAHRHVYITADINQWAEADGLVEISPANADGGLDGADTADDTNTDDELEQARRSHECSYGDCKRRGSDKRREEQRRFIAGLREKHPRTLAFASWK